MSAEQETGVDRRAALKKAAAAGAIVWTAPIVTSSVASAQTGCTPKCRPTGTVSVTSATASALSCTGTGSSRQATFTLTLTSSGSFSCPCGGTAVVTQGATASRGTATRSGNVITVTLPVNDQGGALTVTASTTGSCTDRSGDACTRTCSTPITTTVTFANSGNCNGSSAGSPTVGTTSCT